MADDQPKNWFDRLPPLVRHLLSSAAVSLTTILIVWVSGKLGVQPPPVPPPPAFDPASVSQGWVRDDDQVAALVAALPEGEKRFADTPAGRAALGPDDDVYLWDAARSVTGDVLPTRDQGQVGSCVAFGTAAAVEHLLAVQIARDRKDGRRAGEFKELAQEVIYGGSRVEVGGGRLRGDGSVGAWAARWVKEWGVIARGVHGRHDLTRYDESRCRQYGARGVPDELEPLARESPVKAVSQVRTAAEAVQALRQGYPLIVCSDQGFDMTRGADGFARPSGTWMHCMAILGYTAGPRTGFWIQNSWGPTAHRGPVGVGSPPAGGFWADAAVVGRMLAQGDSWAFGDAAGFPAKAPLPVDWFVNARPDPRKKFAFDTPFALAP